MFRGKMVFRTVFSHMNVGGSSSKVRLVSTIDNRSVSVNVLLLSLVSDHMSSVLKEVLSDSDDIIKVLVPVEINVLSNLASFIAKGVGTFNTKAEIMAVGQAAGLLGISTVDWGVKVSSKRVVENEEDEEDGRNGEEVEIEEKAEKIVQERAVGAKEVKVGSQASKVKEEVKKDMGNLVNKLNPTTLRVYNCDPCKVTYRTRFAYDRHNALVHGATVPSYKCELCQKTFYKKNHLDFHIKTGKKHRKLLDNYEERKVEVKATEFVNVGLNPEGVKLGGKAGYPNFTKKPADKVREKADVKYDQGKKTGVKVGTKTTKVKANKVKGGVKTVAKNDPSSILVYDCDPCQLTFKYKYSFARHNEKVHGALVATYKCEVCQKTFYRKQDLDSHKLRKKHKKMLAKFEVKVELPKIKKVPKVVPMMKKVKLHKVCQPPVSGYGKRKFVDGKWVCYICRLPFDSYYKLNPHLAEVHQVKVAKYDCNVCRYKCYHKKFYKKHIQTRGHRRRSEGLSEGKFQDEGKEGDLVMYSCDQCQMTFLSVVQYNYHMKSKKHNKTNKEEDQTEAASNKKVEQFIGSSEIVTEDTCGTGDKKDNNLDIDPVKLVKCELQILRLNTFQEEEGFPEQKFNG